MIVGLNKPQKPQEKTYWYYTVTNGSEVRCSIAVTPSQTFPLSGVQKLFGDSYIITFFAEISKESAEKANYAQPKAIELNSDKE